MKRLLLWLLFIVVAIIAAVVVSTAACGTSPGVADAIVRGTVPGEVVAIVPVRGAPTHKVYLICDTANRLFAVSMNASYSPDEGVVGETVEVSGVVCDN